MKKSIGNLFGVLSILLLFLLVLLFSIEIPAYTKAFYSYEFERNHVCEAVSMKKDDLLLVRDQMIEYLKGNTDTLQIEVAIDGEMLPFFNEREISHMVDVRMLFDLLRAAQSILAILIVLFLLIYYFLKREYKTLGQIMKILSALIFVVFSGFIIFGSLFFDRLFVSFHELFFSNDLWLLDPAIDRLINIVPLPFFQDAAIIIVVVVTQYLIIQYFVGRYILRRPTY